jgi:undecaprenyl-diphosphatase
VSELLREIGEWDGAAMQAVEAVRWEPLSAIFLVVSAWWVKLALFAGVGALADVSRRRLVPRAALAASAAAALAGLAVAGLKELTDRARPPIADPTLQTVGTLPDSSSFPSGHSATAFAAAVAVALLFPRLRVPLLTLAALVALSRVYLGVHYWTDVLVGSALGATIGLLTGWLVRVGPTIAQRKRAPSRTARNELRSSA